MKTKVQAFGRFLSAMIMPNIGAFIAWGLMAALFIDTGWLPNASLNKMVGPMLTYLLPILIGYTGGKMVGGQKGAVMGAIATVGVILSNPDMTMLMGAMAMGPLAGLVIKLFDKAVEGKIRPGFEMLVNNFSVGILGLIMAIVGYRAMGPIMGAILIVLQAGVQVLVEHGLLPLVSIFVEPAKVLFLNNAINHGIFTPLGAENVKEVGKSIFYMIETNPGPGTGVLLAYWMWSKDKISKTSAPGALIVHLLGGIHEISFPYILMQPLLLLATIGGSMAAMLYNTVFHLGLASPASPGSVFAYVIAAPKGSTLQVFLSVVIASAVSFVIATPIIKFASAKTTLEDAQNQKDRMKAESKGQTSEASEEAAGDQKAVSIDPGKEMSADYALKTIDRIVFACDAGMGSSAMGAAVLQKKLRAAGIEDIKVDHASVSEVPANTELLVCHQDLAARAQKSAPQARIITISNFMAAPEYDALVTEIKNAREQAM